MKEYRQEKGERRMKTETLELDLVTKGIEEATDKMQELTDAMNNMPSQVVVRNCQNCSIALYPSQTIIADLDEKEKSEE